MLPGLDALAWLFGSVRIRNRATIGGNLGNASPAGDTIPPLVAAGAVAVLEGANGSRRVAVADIATGPGRTVVGPDEWIDRIEIRVARGRGGLPEVRHPARRRDIDRELGVALGEGRGREAHKRLSGPGGRRADSRASLEELRPSSRGDGRSRKSSKQQLQLSASDISPIDDVRASAKFRREVAGVLLREELGVRRRAISGRAMARTPTRRPA